MVEEKKIYEQAIAVFGETLQQVVAMEELSELIKEISKSLRGESNRLSLITEVTDVLITLEQLKIIYKITEKDIEDEKKFKLCRLNNKIHNDTE